MPSEPFQGRASSRALESAGAVPCRDTGSPSMDASHPARALSRPALGSRLPPFVRSRRPPAVGPDEFRGPAPDHDHGLLRPRQIAGSAGPAPTAHAILDTRPRSPWKPLREERILPGLRLG